MIKHEILKPEGILIVEPLSALAAEDFQALTSEVKRTRGQFAAVERALEAGDECADILMLLAAIRGGVNGLMAEILEDHIRLHMMNPHQKMDSPEELGEDLIALVRAYLK
jgi:DNA-binding FrmR family transcriptional regulator